MTFTLLAAALLLPHYVGTTPEAGFPPSPLPLTATPAPPQADTLLTPPFDSEAYRADVEAILEAAMSGTLGFERLEWLSDYYPKRLSGSRNLEDAIDWIVQEMRQDGFDEVRTQDVMVPVWVRGEESATLLAPAQRDLPMLGLGNSVGTPEEGIEAEVVVVRSFEELRANREKIAGRIVLFNVPFETYGKTVIFRTNGAIEAARHGAVASLIRSVGPFSLQTPHTGNSSYMEGIPRIPQAAITVEDALWMQRMYDRGETIRVRLSMQAQTLPDRKSRNIIADLKGRSKPEEVIVLGGHIDSWDVGQGAMDDGGGVVATWEAVRLIASLGLRPERTIRVVLWTNEENGLRGAMAYRDLAVEEGIENHVLAIESDAGVFDPVGFGFSGPEPALAILREIGRYLEPIGSGEVLKGGGGADIGPLMTLGVPGMGLLVDGSRYFWYHHTEADTVDKLDPEDFNECVATLAVFVHVVASLPDFRF